jgi:hypothetical protein
VIKDIGTEGLAVGSVIYEGADKVKKGDMYENTHKFTIRAPEGVEMELIDVTGIDGGELYIEGFSGKAMIGRMAESTGPR